MQLLQSLRRWFGAPSYSRIDRRRRMAIEPLEQRNLLTVAFDPLHNSYEVPAGKTIFIPLTSTESNGAEVQYRVTGGTANGRLVDGGPFVTMNVSGKDGANQDFTGNLTFKLFQSNNQSDTHTPKTAQQFLDRVDQGYYNGLTFHAIASLLGGGNGKVVQGGNGAPGVEFDDEFKRPLTFNSPGLLALANAGVDSNDSQFFIVNGGNTLDQMPQYLNYDHTIFGQLVEGFDVLANMLATPVTGSTPDSALTINSATVTTNNSDSILRVDIPADASGQQTVIVRAQSAADNATDFETFTLNIVPDAINDPPFIEDQPETINGWQNNGVLIPFVNLEGDPLSVSVVEVNGGSTSATSRVTFAIVGNNIVITPNSDLGPVQLRVRIEESSAPSKFDFEDFTLNVAPSVKLRAEPSGGSISENGGIVQLIATIDVPRAEATTVSISKETTGTPFSFYAENELTANQITIPAGQTSASVFFISYDDPFVEGDETVTFRIGMAAPSFVPPDSTAETVSISVIDDPTDTFTINGRTLTVPGTAGDDVFLFNNLSEAAVFLQVNNAYAYLSKLAFDAIEFDGLGGNDIGYILYSSSLGRGSLTLSPGSLSSTTGLNVKAETIFAYNPSNVVTVDTFQGTSGNDVFYGLQGGSIFSSGSSMIATSFAVGTIVSFVEDSTGHDISILAGDGLMTFEGAPDRFQMVQGGITKMDVRGQNEVYAYGSQASFLGSELHGSAGNDVFYGLPGFVGLKGDTFWHQLMGNPTVRVFGEGGIDVAVMQDTTGNDSLVGGPGKVTFTGDVSFSFGNPVPRYSLEVNNFAYVFMDRLYGGNDTALITDSPGDDDLAVAGNSATFTGGGSYIRTTGFSTLTARSTTGRDIARRSAIDYALTLEGPWVEV